MRPSPELAARVPNYDDAGATSPGDLIWTASLTGYRPFEATVRLGSGEACWEAASTAVLGWGVKTRSGFLVSPVAPKHGVRAGERYWLAARLTLSVIREPVQIVAVVDSHDRRGFAYGTLSGHPVSGEEAFIVHRTAEGEVFFTMRSLTAQGRGLWRGAYPAALVAQRWYRRRYLRALRAAS